MADTKPLPFNLPMKEAAKKFAAKIPLTKTEFETLSDWAKVRSFTVASVTKAEILNDVMDAVQSAIDEGLTLADFNATLGEVMDARGWTGLTPFHAESVMRTNVQMAYGSGRLEQQQAQSDDFPYWQYVAQDADDECGDLNGTVFSIDDAEWYPPIHFNSVLPGNVVSGDVQLTSKMLYAGQVREIKTRAGCTLTVTRNHPVLTTLGMIPACDLSEGQHLLRDTSWRKGSLPVGSVNEDKNYPPTVIEEIFEAFADSFARFRFKRDALDLHGDAARGHSDIDVVATDSKLLNEFMVRSDRPQRRRQNILTVANLALAPLCADGDILGEIRVSPFQQFPFGLITQRNSEFAQLLAYASARDARLPMKFLDRLATAVTIDQGRWHSRAHGTTPGMKRSKPFGFDGGGLIEPTASRRFGATTDLDSAIFEARDKCKTRDASFAGELQRGLAGLIATDQIVEIRDFEYVGHVYDLQTASSIITVNGILTSNCRCHGEPLTQAEAEEIGIDDGSDIPEPLDFAGPGAGDDYEPDFEGIDSEIAGDAQSAIDGFNPSDVSD